ncbi:glycosyltransferase family 2 protein [Acidisphaera rubrifaciens]|uniref:Glycosyl transferase n=1 Tax=Acidisphaera rubrifaciens HS-AP3 TaxID=1231350 RepID=A0A0D6P8Y7_9PROT|nr:glycosyltransferase [Acidisphaera rubrifaciens]GAN77658.1 glycosyl transferase [Acidisphaera rubrifaciens HS-AP3]
MARVSVVVPSYNCAALLPRAVGSVLRQTMQDFELVIVDDGSTDETPDVIARYRCERRIRCVVQGNRGLPAARNAGMAVSTAPYVAFLDADDELAPDALAVLTAALDADPGAGWCVTDITRITGETRDIVRSRIPGDIFYGILEDDFIRRGMFFRRAALAAAGLYDPHVRMREDWDLNIRLIHGGVPFVYVPEPLYWYHWREGSITTGRPHRKLAYTRQVLRKHHKRLADAGDPRAAAIYAECMWDLGRRYFYETRTWQRVLACMAESLAYGIGPRRITRALRGRLTTGGRGVVEGSGP